MKTLGEITREMVKQAIQNGGVFEVRLSNIAGIRTGKASIADFAVGELEDEIADIKRKLTSSYILNTSGRMAELKAIDKRTRVKFYVDDDTGADCVRIMLVDGASKIGQSQKGKRTFKDGVSAIMGFNPDIVEMTPDQVVGAQIVIKQYRAHAATLLGVSNED